MSRLRAQPVQVEPAVDVADVPTAELPNYLKPDHGAPNITDTPAEPGVEAAAEPVLEEPTPPEAVSRYDRILEAAGIIGVGAALGGVGGLFNELIAKKAGIPVSSWSGGWMGGFAASVFVRGAVTGRFKKTK